MPPLSKNTVSAKQAWHFFQGGVPAFGNRRSYGDSVVARNAVDCVRDWGGQELGMPTDDRWITSRITEARKHHPSVTEAVPRRMAEELKGRLRERQLSPKELASLAKQLVADMSATPEKSDSRE